MYGEGTTYFNKATGKWVYQYYKPNGKRGTFSHKDEEVVNQFKWKYLASPDKSEIIDLTLTSWMDSWFERFKNVNLDQNTIDKYKSLYDNHIVPEFESVKLKKLTTEMIQEFLTNKRKKLSVATVREMRMLIVQALSKAVELDKIPNNPAEYTELKSKPKVKKPILSDEGLKKFLTLVATDKTFSHLLPAVVIEARLGLRSGEVLGLNWQDVDFANHTISVARAWVKDTSGIHLKPPKCHGERVIPCPVEIISMLEKFPRRHKTIMFVNSNGNRFAPRQYQFVIKRFFTRAGLPEYRPHDLRKYFTSHLFKNGADIVTIMALGGWKDERTPIQTYANVLTQPKLKAMKSLSAGFNHAISQLVPTKDSKHVRKKKTAVSLKTAEKQQ